MFKIRKYSIKPRFFVFIFVAIIIIAFLFLPKNYEKKYKIDDFEITEKYSNNRYNFSISYNDIIFDYNFDHEYFGKKIINEVNNISNYNDKCIVINVKELEKIPLCKDKDFRLVEGIDLSSFKKEEPTDYKNYDNINVYNLLNKTFLIWNYNNFIYLNNNEKNNIDLFKNDYYNIGISTVINNYLVIANYDKQYDFDEFIIINFENKSKEIWHLNMDISYESYILGTYKDEIYLVDKKNKVEYSFNIKNRKIKTVGTENREGIILNKDKFENVPMSKLINNNMEFDYGYDQNYILEENKLYLKTTNNNILVSKLPITKVLYKDDNCVYYLVNDILYYYDRKIGEVKVIQNFEWNFNNNGIFIY